MALSRAVTCSAVSTFMFGEAWMASRSTSSSAILEKAMASKSPESSVSVIGSLYLENLIVVYMEQNM